MLMKIGVALAAVPLVAVATVAGTGVAVVDVKESGPDGHHIVVPVPLLLAQAVTVFTPPVRMDVRGEDRRRLEQFLPVAQDVLKALAEAPDGELVSVDDGEDHVRIAKVGDTLRILVDEPGTHVSVNVPLDVAREALQQVKGGRIQASGLVGALRQARLTDLVEVEDRETHVKISVW
jgi:hypothetical protein